jgi:hypothetical protein
MTRTFDEVAWNWLELTSTDTLSIVALAEKTVNTTDGESKTRLGRTAVKENGLANCVSESDEKRANDARKKASKHTIESSCCRWPCRRICLQSF